MRNDRFFLLKNQCSLWEEIDRTICRKPPQDVPVKVLEWKRIVQKIKDDRSRDNICIIILFHFFFLR